MEKLSLDEFQKELVDYMEHYHPDYNWSCQPVLKNNGLELISLIGNNQETSISPSLYINEWFDQYLDYDMTFQAAATMIENKYMEIMQQKPDVNLKFLTSWQDAKDNITLRLISATQNEKLLSNSPHRIVGNDLAVTYRYLALKDENGIGSCLISNDMLDNWNISEEEMYRIALENTREIFPIRIQSITDVILNLYAKQQQ